MNNTKFFFYVIMAALFGVSVVQKIRAVDQHSTVKQYKQRFGLTALNMACKYANYGIVVGLLQEDGAPDAFKLQQIIQILKTKQLHDLRYLFMALQKKTLTLTELIQCIGVLKEQAELRDSYGKIVKPVRVCHGNSHLFDFALFDELSLELQKKICRISNLNENKFIQKDFH